MQNRQYRITDDTLLSLNFSETSRVNFRRYENNQWLEVASIDKTVWSAGIFKYRLNKTYSAMELVSISDTTDLPVDNQRCVSGGLLFRQGFSWDGIFAILLVIKGMESGKVLLSKVIQMDDLVITQDTSTELIQGSFWTYSVPLNIPRLSEESLMASVQYVSYTNVESSGANIGYINNYPKVADNFEPLNTREPLPDFVVVDLSFDNNQYVTLTPKTLEQNKTLEQSILDYFGFTSNLVPVTVEHIVRYGTEAVGYKSIRVSDEDNAYLPITIGLDFRPWPLSLISVFVSTEITCNNVTMKREQQKIFDLQNNIAPFLNAVVANQELTVYPVSVVRQSVVQNTIIETKTETKIIPILQPVYVEMVISDIVFENKNISFDQVKVQSIMEVSASSTTDTQYILSKASEDGKYYFDLSSITQPEPKTPYIVFDSSTRKLITKGNIQ